MATIATDRRYVIAMANRALASFSPATISHLPSGWYVSWHSRGELVTKRWQCRGGQDFYPTWSQQYPGGGTSCTALSQLIRWCKGEPVLPISTWRYWASETCKLLPLAAVDELLAAGYPEHVDCVLCHQRIVVPFDWWSLNGVSGPCCGWTSGCGQKPPIPH